MNTNWLDRIGYYVSRNVSLIDFLGPICLVPVVCHGCVRRVKVKRTKLKLFFFCVCVCSKDFFLAV